MIPKKVDTKMVLINESVPTDEEIKAIIAKWEKSPEGKQYLAFINARPEAKKKGKEALKDAMNAGKTFQEAWKEGGEAILKVRKDQDKEEESIISAEEAWKIGYKTALELGKTKREAIEAGTTAWKIWKSEQK